MSRPVPQSWDKFADRLEELSARLLRMANDARRRARGELLGPEPEELSKFYIDALEPDSTRNVS